MVSGFEIERGVLKKCTSWKENIEIPDGVRRIGEFAFSRRKCKTVIIPDSAARIDEFAFDECRELTAVIVPESVTRIYVNAFYECPNLTIVCREGSYTHQFCVRHHFTFIFDYQYEAFNGVLPPGIEKLSSPFLADEEQPYVFISYSHKDRDYVLGIIKGLYENGWRIWYDEGLTIGDSYDETLENHVKNCSAFLLFVTENSLESKYIKDNEIPWAIEFEKPIIKCILKEGLDYEITKGSVAAAVSSDDIESVLERIDGLDKGEKREAKGISVVVDPAKRGETSEGSGFAYCLYCEKNSAAARAIMLEAINGGCMLYNAVEEGEDEEKLRGCACFIVFLDKEFLSAERLTKLLTKEFKAGKDIAVCQLEEIDDSDLPDELLGLHKMQWLDFAHGLAGDMNTKLARHLQKRGCRDDAVIPGFEYTKTKKGIVLTRYRGTDSEPRIEKEYGGVPVIAIDKGAFKNCINVERIVIPEGVKKIGKSAFEGCYNLVSVTIPKTVSEIGTAAFQLCRSLPSVTIPEKVKAIGDYAFCKCSAFTSVDIPKNVKKLGEGAFQECKSLKSVTLPDGLTAIGSCAFYECPLDSIDIPKSVCEIGEGAFYRNHFDSVIIPDGVATISKYLFHECRYLVSVSLPDSVTSIEWGAFDSCRSLSSINVPDGVSWIGPYVFQNCEKLTRVNIPYGIKKNPDLHTAPKR